jgi:hypothetical protein
MARFCSTAVLELGENSPCQGINRIELDVRRQSVYECHIHTERVGLVPGTNKNPAPSDIPDRFLPNQPPLQRKSAHLHARKSYCEYALML